MKRITLSDLIDVLSNYTQKGMGDKKLMVSSDEEGNEFHTLWTTSIERCEDGVLIGGNYDEQERDDNGYPLPVTVKSLLGSIISFVYGERQPSSLPVYVTDDDEINGIHDIYFAISKIDDNYDDYQFHDVGLEEAKKDWLILG